MQTNGINMHADMSTDIGTNIVIEKYADSDGNTISKRYRKGMFLGKGGFAKCYELTDLETNILYAAKIITKASLIKPRAKQKLKSEIKIHKSLSHTNVVKFLHHFEDRENIYILLEICNNKSLNDMVKRRRRLREIETK
jgi:polo-like kinase 1